MKEAPSHTAPLDLAKLRSLTDAATPGPWRVNDSPGLPTNIETPEGGLAIPVEHGADVAFEPGDAAFIAASRTALPMLIDEVERLRALVGDKGGA